LPTKIETQTSFINRWAGTLPLVVVGGQGRHINSAGKDAGSFEPGLRTEEEYVRCVAESAFLMIPHSAALMNAQVFHSCGGYNGDYNGWDDIELWSRMSQYGCLINCAAPVFLFRKHLGSGSIREFREQRANVRWLHENLVRARAGQPQIDKEQFLNALPRRPLAARLREMRSDAALYRYRKGAYCIVNGKQIRGAGHLATAFCLEPKRVISGILRYWE